MRNFCLAAFATLVGCSSSEPSPPPEVHLLVGQENETWSADPAPTHVQIELVEDTGRTVIGESNAPASVISVRNAVSTSGTIGTFQAIAVDAAGTTIVRGASVPYLIYNLASVDIPIFVARASTWSRPPENLVHARNFAVTTVAYHQYVIAAGGDVKDASPAVPDVYDAVNWQALKTQPPFPCAPKSMVMVGTTLLCIDDTSATWIDLYDDRTANEAAPAGLMFSEVAGGDVLELADASSTSATRRTFRYLVGATRTNGDPTSKVVRIDDYGTLKTLTLSTPRRGAAAGIVAGNLVVWGGSADGVGAEMLNKTGDAFTPLPFAPDATTGHGLATLDGTIALLAGGKDPLTGAAAPLRTFDTSCVADCVTAELAMPPPGLQRTRVFPLAAGNLLITGDSDDGEFHAFSVVTSSGMPEITERALRERRKGATALLLPNGQPGVLGGENPETGAAVLSIESFFF